MNLFRPRENSENDDIPAAKHPKVNTDSSSTATSDFISTKTSATSVILNNSGNVKDADQLPTLQNINTLVHPNDIGNFVGGSKRILKSEIKMLLQNIWHPDENYKYPFIFDNNGEKRRFQPAWLDQFPWLSYSVKPDKEGAYCRYCVLMGKVTAGGQIMKNFVQEPFTMYRKGTPVFIKHQKTLAHNYASDQVNILLSNSEAIDEMLCNQRRAEKERERKLEIEYRRRARDMIETVKTLGLQEMPYRGHRDSGPLDLSSHPGPNKESNFKALLRYRALGDKQLYEDIQNAPKNMMLISSGIQNQMIQACGEVIKESLLNDIKKAGIYSIIADCTADISRSEQLAYAVRYVTPDGEMREDMIGLMNPTATTGAALAGDITNGLRNFGLLIEDSRGQAYDGCGNMSGHINGAQALIKEMNPLAIYTHCHSHKLNLALARALSVDGIKQMLATLSQVSDFLSGSAQRVKFLEKNVEECIPETRKKRIKPLCRVRWVEQHESVITFNLLLKPILMTLDDIIEQGNTKAVSKAEGFLAIMTQFPFIVTLEMAVELFDQTLALSKRLQKPDQTLGKSMQLVKDTIVEVESKKNKYDKIFKKAKELADELDIPVLMPRGRVGKKRNDQNSPEEFYRTQRWEPFIDEMVTQLKNRFPDDHPAIKLQEALPPHIKNIKTEFKEKTLDSIAQAAEIYEKDFPFFFGFRSELNLWHQKMLREEPKDPEHGWQMKEVYLLTSDLPNVRAMVRLLMTIPATSCTAERAFSTLKRIKSDRRSTMGEERLEALMLISMFGQERLSVDKALDKFMKLRPRRC